MRVITRPARLICALAAAWLAGAGPLAAETVVARMSDTVVEIRSNFVGAELLLFGLIEPDETTPHGLAEDYDIVVVVRGPAQEMVTRRRERVAGIWVNRESVGFRDAPTYFATLANRPIEEITGEDTLLRHRMGLAYLRLDPTDDDVPAGQLQEFREAMIRNKVARGLYLQDEAGVSMLTPALFSTRIPMPAHISTGSYSARILVFSGGRLVATQRESFWVTKSGFEARIFRWSERQPFFYGVGAVAIALFAGWFAGVLFRRD